MAVSEAQYRASHKYDLKTYKRYGFIVRKDDTEFINWMASQENKNGYITGLIREDMKKATKKKQSFFYFFSQSLLTFIPNLFPILF